MPTTTNSNLYETESGITEGNLPPINAVKKKQVFIEDLVIEDAEDEFK